MVEDWEALDIEGDAVQKLKAESEKKARDIASRFYGCFGTEDGQFVINRLKEITIDRPVLNANSTQFGAGIREGQNIIVRQILDQIAIAEKQ
jgi:hypothetical protein